MSDLHEPGTYRICIKGHLGQRWAAQFTALHEGVTITLTENGETHLTGPLADQAALHSILRTIRDSGLELLSVNRIKTD